MYDTIIINKALSRIGLGMRNSLLSHYERFYQPDAALNGIDPEMFHDFLHESFGAGSAIIENLILQCAESGSHSGSKPTQILTTKKIFDCD